MFNEMLNVIYINTSTYERPIITTEDIGFSQFIQSTSISTSTIKYSIARWFYRFIVKNTFVCSICDTHTSSFSVYDTLDVDIHKYSTVTSLSYVIMNDWINAYFGNPVILEKHCHTCKPIDNKDKKGYIGHINRILLFTYPMRLQLRIMRYHGNQTVSIPIKYNNDLTFGHIKYKLKTAIFYNGNATSGHYYAKLYTDKKVYMMNDSSVTEENLKSKSLKVFVEKFEN
jgi:ubiquitin C-terminal hydrolase